MKRTLPTWCKEVKKSMIDDDLNVTELAERVGLTVRDFASDVMEYESCKRALEEKNSQIQRYENIISTTRLQNKAINEQLSAISSEDEELILRKLSELEEKRKELANVHEKKDRCAAVYAEVNKRHTEIPRNGNMGA